MIVGVLSLQGAFREHLRAVQRLGHEAREVKSEKDLRGLQALILPGGESTAMGKIIERNELREPLRDFAANKPTMGTCAGAILLAKDIIGETKNYLGVLDIAVERNAYGSQLDSFVGQGTVGRLHDFPLVFIRAPLIRSVSASVEVIAKLGEDIIGVRSNNLWACTFHPEMTADTRLHALFLQHA
ncbi:MAG: pyridoxal 5'-phosphate synthase glutaminase subunit PdxT [Peptococcaceae bacterium]|nr:pyridoxal 5'-phosphate synthase glutaminase subunit PdxT [Peptococcaceae bacterium]